MSKNIENYTESRKTLFPLKYMAALVLAANIFSQTAFVHSPVLSRLSYWTNYNLWNLKQYYTNVRCIGHVDVMTVQLGMFKFMKLHSCLGKNSHPGHDPETHDPEDHWMCKLTLFIPWSACRLRVKEGLVVWRLFFLLMLESCSLRSVAPDRRLPGWC